MKVFLDTNVLIAACVQDHEHHSRAVPILEQVHEKKVTGFLSAHSLLEMLAVLTRLPRSPRITPQEAGSAIEVNFLSHFLPVALTGKEYGEFVIQSARAGIAGGQAYDALILRCAEKCGAERIYTFDVRHFQQLASKELAARLAAP
jgi:predicted nucleic acid-binding protein